MSSVSNDIVDFVRTLYPGDAVVPLHAPRFDGREQDYVRDCVASTFVSSVGAYVDRFEQMVSAYTGAAAAVATVNGTAALHAALRLVGVRPGDLVITQPLTFVATCNAIAYCGAAPLFIDVDADTLGLSPAALSAYLEQYAERREQGAVLKATGQVLRACVPMHTFGHPVRLDSLVRVCEDWGVALVEDAAESLGSLYQGRHTGRFGQVGVLSFNGNKIVTTGGGGMMLFEDAVQARHAKHLTTTAKLPHPYEYVHDEVGYNYRLPNLNAALGCAQIEQLECFVGAKRALADRYRGFFLDSEYRFFDEPAGCRSNYWLNAVICEDRKSRDHLLSITTAAGVATRPIWQLMNRLPMYASAPAGELTHAAWLAERVVSLPSSPRVEDMP